MQYICSLLPAYTAEALSNLRSDACIVWIACTTCHAYSINFKLLGACWEQVDLYHAICPSTCIMVHCYSDSEC